MITVRFVTMSGLSVSVSMKVSGRSVGGVSYRR